MRTLVIHPRDNSTLFLRVLYEGLSDCVVLDDRASNGVIRRNLASGEFDRVMLLGHGCEYGLFSPSGHRQFGRYIIASEHVQFLRNVECIAIWCNANQFGYRYDLRGLFSSMIISELSEAATWNVNISRGETELHEHSRDWTEHLNTYIRDNWNDLTRVPNLMNSTHNDRLWTPLEQFNYPGIFYLPDE